jgi:hypothetical protein
MTTISTRERSPVSPTRRWGIFSCLCCAITIAIFVGLCVVETNFNVVLSDNARRLTECRFPASVGALGMLLGAIGIARDKRKTLAILGIVANLVVFFILLTLDAGIGMPGP